MLVNEPLFSVCAAAGIRKTSVGISVVRSSPVSISGASYQNEALSISWKSRTTSHSSCAIASLCSRAFAEPTAGFSPSRKKPFTCPSRIRTVVGYVE